MSWVDVRDRLRDSPERARSLLTVRAAISSARLSLDPRSSCESLMCSYCRARLVPFLTPRGGTVKPPGDDWSSGVVLPGHADENSGPPRKDPSAPSDPVIHHRNADGLWAASV